MKYWPLLWAQLFRPKTGSGVDPRIPIFGDERREARIEFVPAGRGAIVRPSPGSAPEAWPTVMQVDVPAGGEASVRLP